MPDRIDTLLHGLAHEAARVPVGETHHGGGLHKASVRDVRKEALRLIRAWQGRHPAPPTLEDLMDAFIADYPNGHLMVRHDPEPDSRGWVAAAYGAWEWDAETPEKAIAALRAGIQEATISELPILPEGYHWVIAPPSRMWMPIRDEHRSTLQGTASRAPTFGSPPPGAVVFDPTVCDERLYVPVKA